MLVQPFFLLLCIPKIKPFIEFPCVSWTNLYSYLLLALLLKICQTFLVLWTRKSNYKCSIRFVCLVLTFGMVILALFGVEFYLFVSHGGMNDRWSTCKSRNVRCVVTLPFWHFCWCRGFCHRTESDLFLFLLHVDPLSFIPPWETNR